MEDQKDLEITEKVDIEIDEQNELQLAENVSIETYEASPTSYAEKRLLLEKTKIVKQTWSVQEIYQKIKSTKLILSPEYQRNSVWSVDKKTAFIESLFMDILVPPIYVVEVPGNNMLEDSIYEVVDGKQRLTAIYEFLTNEYKLQSRSLEYFTDLFSDKLFSDLQTDYISEVNNILSSVLDIYVITANSPEFTKYDIFSRLNKGSEKLKVNEIRKAIYRSQTLQVVDQFVKFYLSDKDSANYKMYQNIFSSNDIKRYEDYGRFYRSIAFYNQSKIDLDIPVVEEYNSRPREMINHVLQIIQNKEITITEDIINSILDKTLQLYTWLNDVPTLNKSKIDYIIDTCIPFLDRFTSLQELLPLIENSDFMQTFEKSVATTSNVNKRLQLAKEILNR